MIKRKLCPRCETGKKTYELDRRSSECPYLGMHNGKQCAMFVEIQTSQKERLLKRIFKGKTRKYCENRNYDEN